MKIFVTGTRGIPDIPGGVEKHCQELYPRIFKKGHEVLLATRSPYFLTKIDSWQGVRLVRCYAPRIKSLEAIVHTFIALVRARCCSPDVVHIHAIGPSLLVPFARLLGLKVVVTNHGPDYNRQKWGQLAKSMLRLGEKLGGCFANEIIVISRVIKDIVHKRCHRNANLIYNGVSLPILSEQRDYLSQIGVEPQKYILAVARFVPEKGLHDLINVFRRIDANFKLVIAGDADHETQYSRSLRELVAQDKRVVLTGYITGEPLNQVYSHAALFVLPSYHEGLPIALLEAMSYGVPVLVSDIPANKEVDLSNDCYFICGDLADLEIKVKNLMGKCLPEEERGLLRQLVKENYCWDRITDQTINVYRRVAAKQ
jgi:glycosyltransferase involved in cell wall biosynthesis